MTTTAPPLRTATTIATTTATMPDIDLRLSLDELNLVLEGVGHLPFARVFALVGKIQAQAGAQLQQHAQAAATGGQPG